MFEDALTGNIRVIGFCPNCGIAIPARTGRGRRRIFCSEKCRSKYARQHPSQTSWRNIQDLTCEYCGGQFQVYQKTSKPRWFCSVSCARRFAIREKRRSYGEMEYIVMITYKLVRCRHGLYYTLFVETDRPMPLNIWLDAQVGEMLNPTHVRIPVLGRLALRPGWHTCTVPFTDWIGKKSQDGRLLQRPDTAWIECEVEGDEQIVTDRRALRTIPNGWYRYKTRPGQPFPWFISDRIRLLRPLTHSEVETLCTAHGVKAQSVATES